MNSEQQRIAIAEACEWKEIRAEVDWLPKELFGIFTWPHPTNAEKIKYFINRKPIPDYLNDLNAMHEAEKVLEGGMRSKYDAELTLICSRDYNFIWESTASQRAEAFLRTIGKWEESK